MFNIKPKNNKDMLQSIQREYDLLLEKQFDLMEEMQTPLIKKQIAENQELCRKLDELRNNFTK